MKLTVCNFKRCPKCKKPTFEQVGTEDMICSNCGWHENSLGEKWFEKEVSK